MGAVQSPPFALSFYMTWPLYATLALTGVALPLFMQDPLTIASQTYPDWCKIIVTGVCVHRKNEAVIIGPSCVLDSAVKVVI